MDLHLPDSWDHEQHQSGCGDHPCDITSLAFAASEPRGSRMWERAEETQAAGLTYLIPDIQVLCEGIASSGTCAIVWHLHDVVEAIQIYTVDNSHIGQRSRANWWVPSTR
jgi:hypothetical protein